MILWRQWDPHEALQAPPKTDPGFKDVAELSLPEHYQAASLAARFGVYGFGPKP